MCICARSLIIHAHARRASASIYTYKRGNEKRLSPRAGHTRDVNHFCSSLYLSRAIFPSGYYPRKTARRPTSPARAGGFVPAHSQATVCAPPLSLSIYNHLRCRIKPRLPRVAQTFVFRISSLLNIFLLLFLKKKGGYAIELYGASQWERGYVYACAATTKNKCIPVEFIVVRIYMRDVYI